MERKSYDLFTENLTLFIQIYCKVTSEPADSEVEADFKTVHRQIEGAK
jgi:hypothetical protein